VTAKFRPERGRLREAINIGGLAALGTVLAAGACLMLFDKLFAWRVVDRQPWAAAALWALGAAIGVAAGRGSWRASGRRVRHFRRMFGACAACGYDLTGNESGVCPECGNAT